jgi:hypothetical protein
MFGDPLPESLDHTGSIFQGHLKRYMKHLDASAIQK